jgi:predicted RNA binding protein YcfA (HicA-like mRNA interferase family)
MPPFIRSVAFADAMTRLKMVGWRDDGQEGSHHYLVHPKMPGVRLSLPDHRRHDMDPLTLGRTIESAGLTREQFLRLTGSGYRRYAREIRREVYGMED